MLSATAELLSDDMAQDKRTHYLDVIRQQAERMDGSVKRMLELSRLEAGAKALRRARFTLSDLAQERLDAAVPPDADLHTEVTVSGAEEIDADRTLLARALDAILENAVQHTAPGGSIAVRIEKGVCAVVNTGAAIPADALPRLWEAYYQADASRAAKGDGLGLSIAKTVFDLHGYAYGAENTDEGPAVLVPVRIAAPPHKRKDRRGKAAHWAAFRAFGLLQVDRDGLVLEQLSVRLAARRIHP